MNQNLMVIWDATGWQPSIQHRGRQLVALRRIPNTTTICQHKTGGAEAKLAPLRSMKNKWNANKFVKWQWLGHKCMGIRGTRTPPSEPAMIYCLLWVVFICGWLCFVCLGKPVAPVSKQSPKSLKSLPIRNIDCLYMCLLELNAY